MRFSVKVIFALVFLSVINPVFADDQVMQEENRHCLKCHANQTYSYYNDWIEAEQKRIMNPFYIIDSTRFVNGVHGSFKCFDCHSSEYETYPHSGELKLEPLMNCIDCHGGDDTYADYQFDKIEEEFQKSVHYEMVGESFSCSKCHNQHYYTPTARNSSRVSEIVSYNNSFCLSCHDNPVKYQTVSSHSNPSLAQVHDWLPNQDLHFKQVRCIECHTVVVDSFMVSHNIMPKLNALKSCHECHSSNSLLKASLYKYQNIQARAGEGKFKAFMINEAYIIGANQSPFMRTISFIIFGCTVLAIGAHWVFRIIKRK
ncbi:cytochrome c3 family protein [Gaoshiqia sp. Z1-71]|uniref:cytochrome c3 family protein n=1 Tax=Gaoshiqia hydrogeniformans TaxID=3290090 RepID=UPI003BF8E448